MDSDETFADLDDLSLEDVVVMASSDAIRAATGLGILPHFEVVPGDAGSWEPGATARVTCTFDGADHYLDCEEFAFHAPYAALKAMAYGRPEGVLTLASAFLVHYRAAAMSGELALRLISRESMPEDFGGGPGVEARIRASWRTVETLWPRELGSWHVAGIDGAAVNEIASRLVVTLRDSSFDPHAETVEGDETTVSFDFSWRDFEAYDDDPAVPRGLVARIVHALREEIDAGRLRYSKDATRMLDDLEMEEADAEDSFVTGELVEDSDGRVHCADALRDR